jgi:predicted small integral membrane protein
MSLAWMVWTVPTAIFFAVIGVMLAVMSVWQTVAPSRLFIGLVVSAYAHLAWIGLVDARLWIALVICLVWMVVVMRWG